MLISDISFSLSLFALFLLILIYWSFSRGLPLLKAWLKGFISTSFPRKLRAALIILFLAMIILVNVLPFNFKTYEEEELKYDYSFYLQANSELRYGTGYGTNLGGLFLIYPIIYKIFGISSLSGTILLKKILMILTLPLYFLLIRKILRFFIPQGRWQYPISTLLALLYLSMPQINLFFWNQRFYYFSTHFFFILAFAFLLQYLKSKSAAEFLLYLLSSAISLQTRPEFAAFALLLLAIHLLSVIDFSARRFRHQDRKEKLLLLLNIAFVAFLAISVAVFMHNYPAIRVSGPLQKVFWPGIRVEYDYLLGLFNPILTCLFASLCLCALLLCPLNRKYIIVLLLFICALFAYITPTTRLEPEMYTLYIYILLFCILAYGLGWLVSRKAVFPGHLVTSLLLILIILSNIYLITSEQNPLVTGRITEEVSVYNRELKLQNTNNTSASFEKMKDSNFLIFDKFSGKLYFSYVFKDTNNTFVSLSEIKNLNTTYKNDTRRTLIFMKRWTQTCTQGQVIRYIDVSFMYPESDDPPLPSDYPLIIKELRASKIKFYSTWGEQVLCEIIFPK